MIHIVMCHLPMKAKDTPNQARLGPFNPSGRTMYLFSLNVFPDEYC